MGWAKFDDQFTDHPKVQAVGPMAELLAMRAVIYAARYETDGVIPESVLPRLAVGITSAKRQISALLQENLWEKCDEGWRIHDFLDYHPSKADKDAERQAARERMRNVRANRNRTAPDVQDELGGSSPSPSPTRPPNASSSNNGFTAFNAKRAVAAVDKRIRDGLPVKSRTGLATTIAKDPEHIAESKRIYAHRDCEKCDGDGYLVFHPQAGGSTQAPCDAGVSSDV